MLINNWRLIWFFFRFKLSFDLATYAKGWITASIFWLNGDHRVGVLTHWLIYGNSDSQSCSSDTCCLVHISPVTFISAKCMMVFSTICRICYWYGFSWSVMRIWKYLYCTCAIKVLYLLFIYIIITRVSKKYRRAKIIILGVRGKFKRTVQHNLQQGMFILYVNMALVVQSKSSKLWWRVNFRV